MDFFKPYIKKYCFCGSGKAYISCCKKSPYKPNYTKEIQDEFAMIFEKSGKSPTYLFKKLVEKSRIKECLCLGCNNPSIKSHLIGKTILKTTFDSSHIKAFDIDDSGISFKKIGVNDATTFHIWCNQHDTELFKNIDRNGFEFNIENLGLLVLRTLGNETRKKQLQLRMNYAGIIDNEFEPHPFYNPHQLVGCYQGYVEIIERYRMVEHYLQTNKLDKIHNFIFELPRTNTLFVSSAFQLDIDLDGVIINETDEINGSMTPLVLNIFTTEDKNYIIISLINKDLKIYSNFLKKLTELYNNETNIFKTIINNLLHYFCENIFISNDFTIPEGFQFLSPYEFKKKEVNYYSDPIIKYII